MQWQIDKKQKEFMNQKEADKFIRYSFRRNFLINGREIELFEPPKILGDVFESLMGAIFLDGGIKKVLEVYQHILSPFVLFTAKYSKKLYKEPKDEFILLTGLLKMMPVFRTTDIEVDDIDSFSQSLTQTIDPSSQYSTIESKKYTVPSDLDQKQKYRMVKCEILYNNNEVMTIGFGSSRRQAERNASIQGQIWLHQNKGELLRLAQVVDYDSADSGEGDAAE